MHVPLFCHNKTWERQQEKEFWSPTIREVDKEKSAKLTLFFVSLTSDHQFEWLFVCKWVAFAPPRVLRTPPSPTMSYWIQAIPSCILPLTFRLPRPLYPKRKDLSDVGPLQLPSPSCLMIIQWCVVPPLHLIGEASRRRSLLEIRLGTPLEESRLCP